MDNILFFLAERNPALTKIQLLLWCTVPCAFHLQARCHLGSSHWPRSICWSSCIIRKEKRGGEKLIIFIEVTFNSCLVMSFDHLIVHAPLLQHHQWLKIGGLS